MISTEGLEEFKQIYLEEFGVELSTEGVLEKALQVLNLVKILVQPRSNNLNTKDLIDERDKKVQL